MEEPKEQKQSQKEDLVFFVRVQYRCNTSFQGTVQWMDGKKWCIFRSVLELGNLICEAKKQMSTEGDEGFVKTWQDKEDVS